MVLMHKHASYMDIKVLKYFNTLAGKQQYPGARCDGDNLAVFINQHSASSSVESMIHANMSDRARTAVVNRNF